MTDKTYPPQSLETAACLWENVLAIEGSRPRTEVGRQIRRMRERIGSSALRLSVLSWVDAVDAAWKAADTDPATGREGFYDRSFDWDFIPEWIEQHVDWSGEYPELMEAAR